MVPPLDHTHEVNWPSGPAAASTTGASGATGRSSGARADDVPVDASKSPADPTTAAASVRPRTPRLTEEMMEGILAMQEDEEERA